MYLKTKYKYLTKYSPLETTLNRPNSKRFMQSNNQTHLLSILATKNGQRICALHAETTPRNKQIQQTLQQKPCTFADCNDEAVMLIPGG